MTEENKINEEIDNLRQGLTIEELNFVDNYLKGMSPFDAYRSAFTVSDTEARTRAKNLIHAPLIKLYIDAMQREVVTRSVMTLEAIDQKLSDIASVDLSEIVEISEYHNEESGDLKYLTGIKDTSELTQAQKAALKKIIPTDNGLVIELNDKLKALDMLIKRRGGYTDKQEIAHTGNVQVVAMVGHNGRGPVETK